MPVFGTVEYLIYSGSYPTRLQYFYISYTTVQVRFIFQKRVSVKRSYGK